MNLFLESRDTKNLIIPFFLFSSLVIRGWNIGGVEGPLDDKQKQDMKSVYVSFVNLKKSQKRNKLL